MYMSVLIIVLIMPAAKKVSGHIIMHQTCNKREPNDCCLTCVTDRAPCNCFLQKDGKHVVPFLARGLSIRHTTVWFRTLPFMDRGLHHMVKGNMHYLSNPTAAEDAKLGFQGILKGFLPYRIITN
jgi:hypothetical protein